MEHIISSLYEVSLLKVALVFIATVLSDALWALYIRKTNLGKALSASSLSAVIVLTAGVVAIEYVNNNWYLVPAALGAFVGTYFTIRFDNRKKPEIEGPKHKFTRV
ncbi:MAG: hypothetical protein WC842_04020 [Candidatus Paceibacterota bacterium]|jgi:drug/metabolite transporter (DMT)-like permease